MLTGMSDEWRPPIPTGREDVLVEGFPPYLRESVLPWLIARMPHPTATRVSQEFMLGFQRRMKLDLGYTASGSLDPEHVRNRLRKLDDATFTNLLSYAVHEAGWGISMRVEAHLSDGGSAWTVMKDGNNAVLTHRVSAGVADAVAPVLAASDAASRKLQEAWADAFGVNPRPSVAYGNAVVAVETAALSVIKITKQDPTLADLFSILEAENPKWELVLRDSDKAPGAKTLAAMLRTIWRGHESRHGRPDYRDASIEEARAAVLLAATLVDWFTTGVVRPVSGK